MDNKLLPKRVNPTTLIFGIQGGVGSFNEQAILHYLKTKNINKFKIKYLYTSRKVLSNLHRGNIDFGLFAIHNSVGGMVTESIEAMADYKFKIVEELAIPIEHYLMKRKEVSNDQITTIMAHPQVFRQCQSTLAEKYPYLKQVSGKGDLIDTAKAAYILSRGKIARETAILGPKRLSDLYGLEIIANNLQDDKTNSTSFLLVKR